MKKIKVKALPGARCPMEHDPRRYITDAAPVEVPQSLYYLRLLDEGSLVPAGGTTKKQRPGRERTDQNRRSK